ncbi:MAG: hypothetical protein AAF892_09165 [Cyanobacteria bacterium P01_D01_bin.71]
MQTPYPEAIEQQMQRYYTSLSEKDRRCYVAIEAVKLGHGGISYIRRVLDYDCRTIKTGMQELSDETALDDACIRRPGVRCKAALDTLMAWKMPVYGALPTIQQALRWMMR